MPASSLSDMVGCFLFFFSISSKTWQSLMATSHASASTLLINYFHPLQPLKSVLFDDKKCSDPCGISSIFILKEQTNIYILKSYEVEF